MSDLILQLLAAAIVTLTVFTVRKLSSIESSWVQKLLDWFPAILFAYVIPALFTHIFNLDLSKVWLHTLSKNWIIPVTILLVMSALPFKQLRIVGVKPLLVFVGGSAVIAILPVALVLLFSSIHEGSQVLFVEQGYWKGLVPIVGGWIGGSTSQLVLKELAGTEEGLFLSVLVLDNILVNLWTILMFQMIKRSDQLNAYFKIKQEINLIPPGDAMQKKLKWPFVILVVLLIVVPIQFLITSFLWQIIVLSVIGLLIGNLVASWNVSFSLKMGGVLIVTIMAILGLKLDFANMSLPIPLVLLAIIWIISHFIFMLAMAVLLRLNTAWVAIGSMANLGGISTAPAVTSAYNKSLMPHAILLAILSMVTGTAWGMLTIYLFENLI